MNDKSQSLEQQTNYFVCEQCNGVGFVDDKKCHHCSGYGVGIYHHKEFLYWGKVVSQVSIWQEKFNKYIDLIIKSILFLFGMVGLAALGLNIYQWGIEAIITLDFWATRDALMFIFWLSLLADLYTYYRIEEESSSKFLVSYKGYEVDTPDFSLPMVSSWGEVLSLKPEQKIDVSKAYNYNSLKVIEKTYHLAKELNHQKVTAIHLLSSLLSTEEVMVICGRLGINVEKMKSKISGALATVEERKNHKHKITFTNGLHLALVEAYQEAYNFKIPQVTVNELFLVLTKETKYNTLNIDPEILNDKFRKIVKEILFDLEIDEQKVKNVVLWQQMYDELSKKWQRMRGKAALRPKHNLDRAYTAVATPLLDELCTDLTRLAAGGHLELCIGREKEIKEIFRLIEGGNTGLILVGPSGVGKRAVVAGIAQLMLAEDVPKILEDKRLVGLNIAGLISGASPAEAADRMLRVANEISRAGNIVLFVDNVQQMSGVTSGESQTLDLMDVLAKVISNKRFIVLAATTPQNYSSYIEQDDLGDVTQKVDIKEMSDNDAILVLESKTGLLEAKNKVFFSYNALEKAVRLTKRYVFGRYLPEKAIDLIKEVVIFVRNHKGEKSLITKEDVAYIISQKVNIPLTKVTEEESDKLMNLESEIHQRVIGQDKAVQLVAEALRRSRAQLRDLKRPIANFLFLGPTGVGKTELAKTVAEVYFGDENNMVRLDMSEYQDQSSVYQMIGAPGSNQGGVLTEAIRKNPFAIVLLDELEKAHPDILNIFLQVMDDGRLTDSLGRTIDFTNVILIATSNAGTQFIQDEVKNNRDIEDIKNDLINNELKKYFRPEFLNRFDGIVVFKPLTMDDVIAITRLLLNKTAQRLEEKGINLEFTDEAVEEFASVGYDPLFGARPLRRTLQNRVDNVLANYLLQNKLNRRDVVVLGSGGEISIKKAERF